MAKTENLKCISEDCGCIICCRSSYSLGEEGACMVLTAHYTQLSDAFFLLLTSGIDSYFIQTRHTLRTLPVFCSSPTSTSRSSKLSFQGWCLLLTEANEMSLLFLYYFYFFQYFQHIMKYI